MKIFSAQQVRSWDAYTIAHEPVASINLMERAATACYKWLTGRTLPVTPIRIFCGKGNNGGDGLALARLLLQDNFSVDVYILESGQKGSDDFQVNLQRLYEQTADIHFIQSLDFFPGLSQNDIVIDALVGTGLNGDLTPLMSALVKHINQSGCTTIAIDMPTGLSADCSADQDNIIKAETTLTFQNYKLAMLVADNASFIGEVALLDIGLHDQFRDEEPAQFELVDKTVITSLYQPRKKFSHKGTFGHAALLAGSYGMMGAAVLCSRACLRSGVGKATIYAPADGVNILQITVPEAMCKLNDRQFDATESALYQAIGIGPGWGVNDVTAATLDDIFTKSKSPLLLDADALSILARSPALLANIPANTVITPHPKEFDRLFGNSKNDTDRLLLCIEKSAAHNIYIVLKGHYTLITTPYGKAYFNSTGNSGMAKGGSGDVLTGLLTGLLAQGYDPLSASLLGVYLHGLAGDIAAEQLSQEAMTANDLVDCIGLAFLNIAT